MLPMSHTRFGSGLLKSVGRVGSSCLTSWFETSKQPLKFDSFASDQSITLGCDW